MAENANAKPRVVEGRSPSFPFIPLGKAIEQARKLERECKAHWVRVGTAIEAFGYKAENKSSGGRQTVAALKAFGLLSDAGSGDERKVQLTDFARRLLLSPPVEVERRMLKEAALRPKVIRDLWERWGTNRPPTKECRYTLVAELGFTGTAAATFLGVYDATIAFAELGKSDTFSGQESDLEADLFADPGAPERQTNPGAQASSPPVEPAMEVRIMEGERVVFAQEVEPEHQLRLVVRGSVDEEVLDALQGYIEAQRRKLGRLSGDAAKPHAPSVVQFAETAAE